MPIDTRLRRYRMEKGLTQTELACRIGVAAATISELERGGRIAWPKIRRAIASELGVPESEIFPERKGAAA